MKTIAISIPRTLMTRKFLYLTRQQLWRCVETGLERTTEQMRDAIVRYYSADIQEWDQLYFARELNIPNGTMVHELFKLEQAVDCAPFFVEQKREKQVNELRPPLSGSTFLSDGAVENSALLPVEWFGLLSIVDEEEV